MFVFFFHASQLIHNSRLAFVDKKTNYLDRVYLAWINVFLVRSWCVWLRTKSKKELDTIIARLAPSWVRQRKNTKQQYFLSRPAMFSIEINNHSLVYFGLLVAQKNLPEYSVWMPLCSIHKRAKALLGPVELCRDPSLPVVNFSVQQFLQ